MDNPPTTDSLHLTAVMKIFICAVFAMLGGIVRELKSDVEMTWWRFSGGAVVGMFCGIVVFCIMRHYGFDDWLTAALTALSGYLGTPALDFISRIVKSVVSRER
jgi:NhaP-type Na+/H+ or K+/H+ antiporter